MSAMRRSAPAKPSAGETAPGTITFSRSEEHTSELQSQFQIVCRLLLDKKNIINISSLAGTNAHPRMAAYNASKFGLNGFSEALMQEVRHDNIKVSYIMPGSVNTEFGGDSPSDEKNWQLTPADIARVVIDLLHHDDRSLASRVEIRPSRPPKK